MSCMICDEKVDVRFGVCFSCANFESLIATKLDMYDKSIEKKIYGSDSLNILKEIIDYAKALRTKNE